MICGGSVELGQQEKLVLLTLNYHDDIILALFQAASRKLPQICGHAHSSRTYIRAKEDAVQPSRITEGKAPLNG